MTPDGGAGPDDEMLAELRALRRRAEPAPPGAVAAAVAAFRWRSVAGAIAGLEFDSVVDDDDQLARVRDSAAERRLRFVGAGRAIEVALVDNNRALAGRVDPPLPGSMVLRHPDGATLSVPVDETGQFFFEAVGRGPVSLRPVPADGAAGDFETEWVTI
jgi:hypothetical protein